MFEGCKLQTWPEQLLFHEVEKVTNISPFSFALPLYPRCVPSSLVVERGMVPGIMGRKEDFYNQFTHLLFSSHIPLFAPARYQQNTARVCDIDCSSPQKVHSAQLVKHKKCLQHRLAY